MTKIVNSLLLITFLIIMYSQGVFAAHYIVGIVNDAKDGTSANGYNIALWNPTVGISDNLSDTIGQNGNSGADNFYMIDCEMLNTPCAIGDQLYLRIFNNGDNHFSMNISVTVTGEGYDLSPNLTLSSIFSINSTYVDDDLSSPLYEVDLLAGLNRTVYCLAVVDDYDGVGISNASARFFDNINSYYSDSDDGNKHYSNHSCLINPDYDINQSEINCSFQVAYYANPLEWNCTVSVTDGYNITRNSSNYTNINSLLSINIEGELDYGSGNNGGVSEEKIVNITNYGNVKINLSLYGYGSHVGDGFAMNCTEGKNISIGYQKYNLTSSNPVITDIFDLESKYINLTKDPIIREFNLNYRQEDNYNDAVNSTYWRIYSPGGISGFCSGNVVFGAIQQP